MTEGPAPSKTTEHARTCRVKSVPNYVPDPPSKHPAFLADLWAHLAAYGVGFLGGIAVCGWVVFGRSRMAALANDQGNVSPPLAEPDTSN